MAALLFADGNNDVPSQYVISSFVTKHVHTCTCTCVRVELVTDSVCLLANTAKASNCCKRFIALIAIVLQSRRRRRRNRPI